MIIKETIQTLLTLISQRENKNLLLYLHTLYEYGGISSSDLYVMYNNEQLDIA